jgi:hypothetical protein
VKRDEQTVAGGEPSLPAWRAFVVQFARMADGVPVFSGRVEHMSSGRRARFESPEELVETLRRLLDEVGGRRVDTPARCRTEPE